MKKQKRVQKSTTKMRKRDKIDTRNRSSSSVTKIKASANWFGDTRMMPTSEHARLSEKYRESIDDPYKFVIASKSLPVSILKPLKTSTKEKKTASLPNPGTLKKRNLCSSIQAFSLEEFASSSTSTSSILLNKNKKEKKEEKKTDIEDINKFTRIGRSDRIRSEVRKLIDCSDVLLHVLDARDPEGTRIQYYEEFLRKNFPSKKSVFVLNKADLVPQNVLTEWMKKLSKEAITIAFSCGPKKFSFKKDFGSNAVKKVLAQVKGLLAHKGRDWMSVGVLGYPNVGKSSLINALKQKKVCTSAPKAGETRDIQYVLLENGIYLIDCPGIVCPKEGEDKVDLVLRGVCRNETIAEPEKYIGKVIQEVGKDVINKYYGIEENWKDSDEFIEVLGMKRKRLMKGGKVDVEVVAKNVIADWTRGRLPWYYKPE